EEPDGPREEGYAQCEPLHSPRRSPALELGLVLQLLELQSAGVPLLCHAIILKPFLMLAEVVCDRRNQVLRSRNIGSRSLDRGERIDRTRHDGAPSLRRGLASRPSPPPLRAYPDFGALPRETPPRSTYAEIPNAKSPGPFLRLEYRPGQGRIKAACLKRPAASALCYQEYMRGEAIRIIGIDPGLRRTGWGVIDTDGVRLAFVSCGSVVSDGSEGLGLRLSQIFDGLSEVRARLKPQEAAIEQTFVNRDATATLKLGQARGIALLVPALLGIEIAEYAPNAVKKTVIGAGHGDKVQIRAMVKCLLPRAAPDSADAADALAIAITHAHSRTWGRISVSPTLGARAAP